MALPQQNRLRSNRDFSRVHRKGKRAATKHLALKALKRKSQSSGIKRVAPKRDAAQRLFQPSDKPVLKAHVVASRSDDITKQSDTKPNGNRTEPIGSIKDQGADGSPFAPLSCGAQSTTHVEGPQFGISISRKVSKRAVVRNRIKRQLKAIIREHFMSINPAWQIVIVVRPPAVECSFDEFLRELKYLLQKLAALE